MWFGAGYCLFTSFFFFKQKTAYEMRISDWSSDVRSSDLQDRDGSQLGFRRPHAGRHRGRIADIEGKRDRAAALRHDLGLQLRQRLETARGQNDLGAGRCERARGMEIGRAHV